MFKFLLFVSCLLFIITSCRVHHVIRDYEYAPPNCDCYVKNKIGVGGYSWYRFKTKARCSKSNYREIIDSLDMLETKRDSLLGYSSSDDWNVNWEEPEDTTLLLRADSLVNIYKQQWISCKMKVRVQSNYTSIEDSVVKVITIKRRITFYRHGMIGRKKLRKVKYLNDRIIKSKEK